jgi:hypothetical protein
MVTGALGFVGVVSVVVGVVLGELSRILWMGVGVGSGFVLGFLVMVGLWFGFVRR